MYNPRKNRSKSDKLFIIETVDIDKYEKKYMIMGSTGNVYDILINHDPTCTCPDFKKRHQRCKHIYFILLRGMNLDKIDEDKKHFTNDDLEVMFANIPKSMTNLYVDPTQVSKYQDMKTKQSTTIKVEPKELSDDVCPICLDDLDNNEPIDYCKYSCGKVVHVECFAMWAKKYDNTCLFCKKRWDPANEEYLNLIV